MCGWHFEVASLSTYCPFCLSLSFGVIALYFLYLQNSIKRGGIKEVLTCLLFSFKNVVCVFVGSVSLLRVRIINGRLTNAAYSKLQRESTAKLIANPEANNAELIHNKSQKIDSNT